MFESCRLYWQWMSLHWSVYATVSTITSWCKWRHNVRTWCDWSCGHILTRGYLRACMTASSERSSRLSLQRPKIPVCARHDLILWLDKTKYYVDCRLYGSQYIFRIAENSRNISWSLQSILLTKLQSGLKWLWNASTKLEVHKISTM